MMSERDEDMDNDIDKSVYAQYRSPSAAEPERGGPGLLRLALLCAL